MMRTSFHLQLRLFGNRWCGRIGWGECPELQHRLFFQLGGWQFHGHIRYSSWPGCPGNLRRRRNDTILGIRRLKGAESTGSNLYILGLPWEIHGGYIIFYCQYAQVLSPLSIWLSGLSYVWFIWGSPRTHQCSPVASSRMILKVVAQNGVPWVPWVPHKAACEILF